MADHANTSEHVEHADHAGHAHDPVLHVKDSYFFEVPRGMWSYHNYEDIPNWLREKNADGSEKYSMDEYKTALDGKIIIPQPFGTPKNLYETYTKADQETYPVEYANSGYFCISKFMIIQLVVAGLLVFLFARLALHVRAEGTPKGRLWNLLETFLLFLRDKVIRPSIDGEHGDHHDEHVPIPQGDPRHGVPHDSHFGYKGQTHHPIVAVDGIDAVPGQDPHVRDATHIGAHGENHGHDHAHVHGHAHESHAHPKLDSDKFLPYLWTLFFFVLFCNLFGILPWLGSPTGAFSTTLVLAGLTMLAGFIGGNLKFGPVGYWTNLVPTMGLPTVLAIILVPMIFLIEVGGLVIKHGILAVRLLANMVAGHLVIAGIMGLITTAAASYMSAKNPSEFTYWLTACIACSGSALFFMLELFVAFLQAYLFTFLSSLFIGAAVHKH
jgi:F-type H+-transporting ATPase subunit a